MLLPSVSVTGHPSFESLLLSQPLSCLDTTGPRKLTQPLSLGTRNLDWQTPIDT
jgi:hypothetical protein